MFEATQGWRRQEHMAARYLAPVPIENGLKPWFRISRFDGLAIISQL